MNKAILSGHVGQDPKVQTFEGGNKAASFSLATSSKYTDKNGEKQTQTEWHKVTVWGKLAGIVEQYVSKGSQLLIEGEIKTRSYDKDGEKRYVTEIVARSLEMLGGKDSGGNHQRNSEPSATNDSGVSPGDEPLGDEDGLPF